MSKSVELLRRILFTKSVKCLAMQHTYSRLHNWVLFGMNYGGGGEIASSGEDRVLSHIIKPSLQSVPAPVIFDVGANIGEYAFRALNHLPNAQIYAFEPSGATFQRLAKRVKETNGQKIQIFNLGFSDSRKQATLYNYNYEGEKAPVLASLEFRLPTQEGEIKVDSIEEIEIDTIDEFCRNQKITRIDFLKIDVEGHELAVLHGARQMIEANNISIIQFEFGPANIYSRTFFYDFWSLLTQRYSIHRILPKGLAKIERYLEQREIFLTTNYLALQKELHPPHSISI